MSVPELTKVLKSYTKEEKKRKRQVPDKPKVPIPQRINMAILDTESKQRIKLDSNTQEEEDEFELNARNKWEEARIRRTWECVLNATKEKCSGCG